MFPIDLILILTFLDLGEIGGDFLDVYLVSFLKKKDLNGALKNLMVCDKQTLN